MIHGKDCILTVDGAIIAASKDLELSRKTGVIEVCSPVDGPEVDYIPGVTSWEASTGGLYANETGVNRLRKIWRDRSKVTLQYKVGSLVETGSAVLTSLKDTGNMGSLMKFSATFQGCGRMKSLPTIGLWSMHVEWIGFYRSNNNITITEEHDQQVAQQTVGRDIEVYESTSVLITNPDEENILILKGSAFEYMSSLETKNPNKLQQNYVAYIADVDQSITLPPGKYCLLESNAYDNSLTDIIVQ